MLKSLDFTPKSNGTGRFYSCFIFRKIMLAVHDGGVDEVRCRNPFRGSAVVPAREDEHSDPRYSEVESS